MDKIIDLLFQFRSMYPDTWHIGIPDWRSIENIPENTAGFALTLRGYIDRGWKPFSNGSDINEEASCCVDQTPGEEWRKHCMTREHIAQMVAEYVQKYTLDVDREATLISAVILGDFM